MRARVGGLFAGYGGLELALHDVLDAEPAWFSEFDKAPSAILAHRFPGVPNLGDITRIDWSAVEPVDIITGGSPCQDLSHAGKRMGMKPGTRSGLWASMLTAITTLRPSLVIWENVRGALSAEATSELESCAGCVGGDDDGPVLRALGRVLGDLAGIGYDAAWTGLRAADVGAPHGRFRVFVLAWSAAPDPDDSASGAGFARSGRQGRRSALDRVIGHGEADAAANTDRLGHEWAGVARDGRDGSADGGHAALTLLPTPAVNDMGAGKTVDAWDAWTASMQARHGNGNGHGASLSIEALRMLPTPNAGDAKQSRSMDHHRERDARMREANPNLGALQLPLATAVTDVDFGQYAPAIARWEAITRPAPSPTEPTGKAGAQRLSPPFVEWLMGLPDGWVTDVPGVTRNDQLKALGNGVVPAQAAAAVRHLLTIRDYALRSAA